MLDKYDFSQPDVIDNSLELCGIKSESGLNNPYVHINDNTINLRSWHKSNGIFISSSLGINVVNNLVRRYAPSRGAGIYLEDNLKGDIKCNHSIGMSSDIINYPNQAYNINNSILNLFDNYSDNTQTGFEFNDACGGTNIVKNTMGYHANNGASFGSNGALYISPSATIGEQKDKFNTFLYGNASWAYRDPTNTNTNRFIIHTPLVLSNPELYPPHFPFELNCDADLFFFCEFNSDLFIPIQECIPTTEGSDIPGSMIANPGGATSVATAMATGAINFQLYNDESKFEITKKVDRGLKELSIFLPDTGVYLAWKDSVALSNASRFNKVSMAWEKQDSSQLRLQLSQNFKTNLDSAFNFAVAFLSNIHTIPDLEDTNNIQGFQQMFNLFTLTDSIHQHLKSMNEAFVQNKIDSASIHNSIVENPTDYETMEKTINNIYLQTLAKGNFSFSLSQLNQISQIAFECPLKSASAVYKARRMYSILHPFTNFDNRAICLEQGMQYRIGNTNQNQSQLSITESNGNLLVKFEGEGNLKQLSILNPIGQTITSWQTNQKQENLNINSLNLSNGFYIIHATTTNGKIDTKKFIYQKQ